MSNRNKTAMNVEEFASEELINKVRTVLAKALTDMGLPEGYRQDRLLSELTREICLAFM